jgi:Xaa-Pro aminopeptidase
VNQLKEKLDVCRNMVMNAPWLADMSAVEKRDLLLALQSVDTASTEIISKKYKNGVQTYERLGALKDLVMNVLEEPAERDASAIAERDARDASAIARPLDSPRQEKDAEALANLRAAHTKTLEELQAAKEQLMRYGDEMAAHENMIRTLHLEVLFCLLKISP